VSIYTSIPAYTYKITCIPTGQFYYGYRSANILKGRLPADDLWIHYFTSSAVVKQLIIQHGKTAFLTEILDTDINPIIMYWKEQNTIKDNWETPGLLNGYYQNQITNKSAFRATEESNNKGLVTRRASGADKIGATKMVQTKKARGTDKIGSAKTIKLLRDSGMLHIRQLKIAENKRKNGTDKIGAAKAIETQRQTGTLKIRAEKMVLTKQERGTDKIGAAKIAENKRKNGTDKIGAAKIAKIRKERGTDKIGAAKRAEIISKTWEVTYQNGEPTIIKNLAKFCRENNLDNATMGSIAKTGRYHKGWQCKFIA
jgi:hypothetical protein